MKINDRAAIGLVINEAHKIGAKLPKQVLDAHALALRIQQNAARIGAQPADLAAAVTAALTEDRDPAADPEVQRLVTATALAAPGLEAHVGIMTTDTLREVCTDRAEAILTAVRKPFNEAVATLEAARAAIGNIPLTDAQAVLNAGHAAAEAWTGAKRAVETCDSAGRVFVALMDFTGLVDTNPNLKALRFAAIDWQTWIDNGFMDRQTPSNPWALVQAGLKLALPTIPEYRDRLAALEAGQRQAQAEAERRNMDALSGRGTA